MTSKALRFVGALLLFAGVCYAQNFPGVSGNPSPIARPGGSYYAPGFFWQGRVISGNATTGSGTLIIAGASGGAGGLQLADGTTISLDTAFSTLTPIIVDFGQGAQETVTPTAVSVGTCPAGNLGVGGSALCAFVTASFSNTHGQSAVVAEGTFGLQTAINLANRYGGGQVAIDGAWRQMGGTNTLIAAAVPFSSVSIVDYSNSSPQYWNVNPTTTTTIAAPATLTAVTVGFGLNGANTTGGTYNGASTYHVAIACVDVAGNESQPSADFSALTAGSGTANQIGFAAPAAQTGCVGYVPYISLAAGTYALAYRVPVATYANGVATPNGVCTLTTIEKVTAACAIANTTYAQTGSAAIVSALTVNTARIWVGLGGTSTTADVVGNSAARTTYAYSPGNHVGVAGTTGVIQAYAAATAPATTVPAIVGTIHLPPGFMNFVNRSIRICGTITEGGGSTATVTAVKFYWNADGSNTTGAGVLLPGPTLTATLSATPAFQFCQVLTTTVAGAGATAGSIQTTQGYITSVNGAAGTAGVTTATQPGAATASLNLAQEARIDIDYLHTTGTDGAPTLTNLSVEAIN